MAGTVKRLFGPLALTTTTTTNIYNNSSSLIYDILKRIIVCNKTGGPITFSIWLGGTGGNVSGTELFNGMSVPANFTATYNLNLKLVSTDFLVGGASANTSLTITGEGEQFVV